MKLEKIKKQLLKDKRIKEKSIQKFIKTLCINKKRPLGKYSNTSWTIEPVYGCNLACGCCATRLFPRNRYYFMKINIWKKVIKLIKELTPYTRVDFANAGEPLLHPNIIKILKIGREISPYSFFEIITNGTMLLKNKITYKELFKAGANIIYVDMYSPLEKHIKLAKKSGYDYYIRAKKTKKDPAAWTYHSNMNIKCIVLQENPLNWSNQKKKIYFSTFFNNLDWKEAKKFGIRPVKKAPNRRCNQPFRTVNVSYDGYYTFCCFDFMRYIYGSLGNIKDGIEGFINFWLGKYMQEVRKLLHNKDRNSHPLCSKCAFTSSRGDIPCWNEESLNYYWENNKWYKNKIKINKNISNKKIHKLINI